MISGLSFWNLEELSEEATKTGKAEEYLGGRHHCLVVAGHGFLKLRERTEPAKSIQNLKLEKRQRRNE